MKTTAEPVSLFSIYRVFFQIGLMSFGGGLVGWIHREVVTTRRWMTDEEFMSGVALAQILPGVNSTNSSIFVGQRLRGVIGATVAVAALLTGPFLATLLVAWSYKWLLGVPGFPSIIEGVAAVALGLLTRLAMQASRGAVFRPMSLLSMLATFVAIGVMRWPLLPVVAVIAPISVALAWPRSGADA